MDAVFSQPELHEFRRIADRLARTLATCTSVEGYVIDEDTAKGIVKLIDGIAKVKSQNDSRGFTEGLIAGQAAELEANGRRYAIVE